MAVGWGFWGLKRASESGLCWVTEVAWPWFQAEDSH